jgi:hypothetical protein
LWRQYAGIHLNYAQNMSFLHFEASAEQVENGKLSWRQFIKASAVLLGLLGFTSLYTIEPDLKLFLLLTLVTATFLLHQLLPLRFRLPLFFFSAIVAFFAFFEVQDALLALAIGAALFGILNLPVSVLVRTICLGLAGLILAYLRLGYVDGLQLDTPLMIVGSLFMFRSFLFLYEARFFDEPPNIWFRLTYFFLIPNLVLLIFPVVDYKTFIRNYYSRPAIQNIRQGLLWMANGLLHFFLYRLIYYYLVPNPFDVEGVYGWIQYVIASYALIVRLAGIFHFSVGIICLFGFDLPAAFRHYFFAHSFSDLWRRINCYWRDFVMKVFYYPIYFKIKHLGLTTAIVISVLLTFLVNWLLHAFQWLWLKGGVLLTVQDVSFWAIFGFAVAGNALYLAKRGKRRALSNSESIELASAHVLRVMGVFLFMAFLWSWWTAPSPQEWWSFLQVWSSATVLNLFWIAVGFVSIFCVGLGLYYWDLRTKNASSHWRSNQPVQLNIVLVLLALAILFSYYPIKRYVEQSLAVDLEPIFSTQLNAIDRDAQFQGYYESMLQNQQLLDNPLEQVQKKAPEDWGQLINTGAIILQPTLVQKTLQPNLNITFKDLPFTTNSAGMRDFPVDTIPKAGTLRMALLGGSIEMGSGVRLEETFENQLTSLLNKERLISEYDSVEILNFAISGTHMLQQLARLEEYVPVFKPDVVIYVAHTGDHRRVLKNLAMLHALDVDLSYDYLRDLAKNVPAAESDNVDAIKRRLKPYMKALINWGYTNIYNKTTEIGAIPVWLMVPALGEIKRPYQDETLLDLADSIGFDVIDLRGILKEHTKEELVVAPWDTHPNEKAHRLIAEEIFAAIKANSDLIDKMNLKKK